jgi:hypothetical protein
MATISSRVQTTVSVQWHGHCGFVEGRSESESEPNRSVPLPPRASAMRFKFQSVLVKGSQPATGLDQWQVGEVNDPVFDPMRHSREPTDLEESRRRLDW